MCYKCGLTLGFAIFIFILRAWSGHGKSGLPIVSAGFLQQNNNAHTVL
jgi:hypothetical protein